MKSSAYKGFLIFAAGAATAALASGMYPKEPITVGEFQERATVLIAEVEALGAYVAVAENGRVGLYTNVGACLPPNPPRPNLPAFAVESRALDLGLKALSTMNNGRLMDEHELVYEVGKCRPYPSSMYQKY
jgi:hypothetical protein